MKLFLFFLTSCTSTSYLQNQSQNEESATQSSDSDFEPAPDSNLESDLPQKMLPKKRNLPKIEDTIQETPQAVIDIIEAVQEIPVQELTLQMNEVPSQVQQESGPEPEVPVGEVSRNSSLVLKIVHLENAIHLGIYNPQNKRFKWIRGSFSVYRNKGLTLRNFENVHSHDFIGDGKNGFFYSFDPRVIHFQKLEPHATDGFSQNFSPDAISFQNKFGIGKTKIFDTKTFATLKGRDEKKEIEVLQFPRFSNSTIEPGVDEGGQNFVLKSPLKIEDFEISKIDSIDESEMFQICVLAGDPIENRLIFCDRANEYSSFRGVPPTKTPLNLNLTRTRRYFEFNIANHRSPRKLKMTEKNICILTSSKKLFCSGENNHGQIRSNDSQTTPIEVASEALDFSIKNNTLCFIKKIPGSSPSQVTLRCQGYSYFSNNINFSDFDANEEIFLTSAYESEFIENNSTVCLTQLIPSLRTKCIKNANGRLTTRSWSLNDEIDSLF